MRDKTGNVPLAGFQAMLRRKIGELVMGNGEVPLAGFQAMSRRLLSPYGIGSQHCFAVFMPISCFPAENRRLGPLGALEIRKMGQKSIILTQNGLKTAPIGRKTGFWTGFGVESRVVAEVSGWTRCRGRKARQ